VSFLYNPTDSNELLRFYLIWVIGLLLLHLLWDYFHPETENFSVARLQHKVQELYSSATVASSVLLGSIMWNGFKSHPLFSSDAMFAPLVISTAAGFMVGVSGLHPKK